jgi:hypothetical protein
MNSNWKIGQSEGFLSNVCLRLINLGWCNLNLSWCRSKQYKLYYYINYLLQLNLNENFILGVPARKYNRSQLL